jgi:hypothetical protein
MRKLARDLCVRSSSNSSPEYEFRSFLRRIRYGDLQAPAVLDPWLVRGTPPPIAAPRDRWSAEKCVLPHALVLEAQLRLHHRNLLTKPTFVFGCGFPDVHLQRCTATGDSKERR